MAQPAQFHPQLRSLAGPFRSAGKAPLPIPLPMTADRHIPLSTRFGMRLRWLRRQKGMTQLQVAIEFGIDRTFLSDLERGRKSVSLPFLEIFALGFGLSLSELLDQL